MPFQNKVANVFAAGEVRSVIYNNLPGIFRDVLATQPDFLVSSLSEEDEGHIKRRLAESEVQDFIFLELETNSSQNVISETLGPKVKVVVLGGRYDSGVGIPVPTPTLRARLFC